jgi:hypothetical protein
MSKPPSKQPSKVVADLAEAMRDELHRDFTYTTLMQLDRDVQELGDQVESLTRALDAQERALADFCATICTALKGRQ